MERRDAALGGLSFFLLLERNIVGMKMDGDSLTNNNSQRGWLWFQWDHWSISGF